jgi:hypothetical protein
MSSHQRGNAATNILLLMVVMAIAGAVASPWLIRSGRSPQEAQAIATLVQIHAAQTDQYGANRMYATIAKLKDAKRLPGNLRNDSFEIDEYHYRHQPAGSWQRWCAEASPKEGKSGMVFAIDETGTVKEFPAGTSPCAAGELTTPGTPVR